MSRKFTIFGEIALLGLIATGIHLAIRIGPSYLEGASNANMQGAVGAPIVVPGYEFSKTGKTVVLVTSPKCRFSKADRHFHERLIKAAIQMKMRVLVLLPTLPESDGFAAPFRGAFVEIRKMSLGRLPVSGTPAILLVDEQTRVEGAWQGQLGEKAQGVVMARLVSDEHIITDSKGSVLKRIGRNSLAAYGQETLVLDVRQRDQFARDHRPGATNIPVDELIVRALTELPVDRSILIDCGYAESAKCQTAQETLSFLNFKNIELLDNGANEQFCELEPIR